MLKISAFTSIYGALPIQSAMAQLLMLGFEGAEIPGILSQLNQETITQIKKFSNEIPVASISIGLAQYRAKGKLSLESRKEYIRRKAVNYVKKCINVASKFTPTPIVYVCTIEPCPRSEDREDLIKKFIEALTLCVDYAEKMEVNLALEHFPGTLVNNTKMLLQIDEMIPSKNLKFLLDVGHMKITKENFVEAVRNMKNKLIHVHVHNNDGVQDLHLPPYKGKITPSELKDFIIELKNINYIGYISIELPEMPEPKKILSKSKVFLKNLISQAY